MPASTHPPGQLTAPNLAEPASLFDILNFRVAEFYGVSGSLVTRMCEGEFGITREEWQYLAMLAALGKTSPSDLARCTTVDRSQGSRTLRALAAKQLVVRESLAGDKRRALVSLSEAGWALYRRVFPRSVAVHRAVLSVLTTEETEVLGRCLFKMHQRALEVEAQGLVDAQAHRRRGGSRLAWEAG
ncbi:MAG: MarR family winged helix-turn-helix transcriptional regulator [Ramlibacter sp.]